MVTHRVGKQPTAAQVQDGGQVELALIGRDLGHVAHPAAVDSGGGEVAAQQVGKRHRPPALSGQPPGALGFAPGRALVGHRRGDRVLTAPPALLEQVGMDPR